MLQDSLLVQHVSESLENSRQVTSRYSMGLLKGAVSVSDIPLSDCATMPVINNLVDRLGGLLGGIAQLKLIQELRLHNSGGSQSFKLRYPGLLND